MKKIYALTVVLLALGMVGCDGDNKTTPGVAFTGASITAGQIAVGNASCTLRAVGEWSGGKSPYVATWSSASTRLAGSPSTSTVEPAAILEIVIPRGGTAISEDLPLVLNVRGADGESIRTQATIPISCPASANRASVASGWSFEIKPGQGSGFAGFP